jgi:hypothetical protein
MPVTVRSVASLFSVVALAAVLGPACSSAGSTMCSGSCDLLIDCPGVPHCTFSDAAAAKSACASACEGALDAIPSEEADAVVACISCQNDAIAGRCSAALSGTAPCPSLCQGAATKPLDDWLGAFAKAAMGDSALACTDGESEFGGDTCGSSGDLAHGACEYFCCAGSCGVEVDVSFSCVGQSSDSPVECTCDHGKSAGKTFSADSCEAAAQLDVWATCNR